MKAKHKTTLQALHYLFIIMVFTNCQSNRLIINNLDKNEYILGNNIPKGQISNSNYYLKSPELAICNETNYLAWTDIKINKLGLYGRRPKSNGAFLGSVSAKKKFLKTISINNWFPYLPQKVAICGIFKDFNTHHSTVSGEEKDWNIFVKPDTAFKFITELAKPFEGINFFKNDKWKRDKMGEIIVEGEITPFSTSNYESILGFPVKNHEYAEYQEIIDSKICLYGPPVREYVHNNWPEIHPSEIIWWKEEQNLKVIALQDASKRYTEEKHFVFSGVDRNKEKWQPWSSTPSDFELLIPFTFDPTQIDKQAYYIYKEEEQNVENQGKEPNNFLHLKLDGKTKVSVYKLFSNTENLKLSFSDICRNEEGTRVQGFIKIEFTLGSRMILNEGLLGLTIKRKKIESTKPKRSLTKDTFQINTVSIYPKKRNGKYELLADYQVETGNKPFKYTTFKDSLLENQVPNTTNKFVEQSQLRGIPLERKNIQFSVNASKPFRVALPENEVKLISLKDVKNTYRRSKRNTTQLFRDYLSTNKLNLELAKRVKVCALDSIHISIHPYYIFCKQGDCNLEDESEEVVALNRRADRALAEQIEDSYILNWDFEAIDLTTGLPMEDSKAKELYRVKVKPKLPTNRNISLYLNRQNNYIYKLISVLTLKDEFGIIGRDTLTFFSHELKSVSSGFGQQIFRNGKTSLREISEALEISYNQFFKERMRNRKKGIYPVFIQGTAIPDPSELKYQFIINFYEQIIEDKHINAFELEGLIKSFDILDKVIPPDKKIN